MKTNFPFGGYPQQPSMMGGQYGNNIMGQPFGQPIGQMGQMGLNANNFNQQMKIPQYKQWFIFLLKANPTNISYLFKVKKNIKYMQTNGLESFALIFITGLIFF
jgi:hypothetical protein